jgi:hypothetical protein
MDKRWLMLQGQVILLGIRLGRGFGPGITLTGTGFGAFSTGIDTAEKLYIWMK